MKEFDFNEYKNCWVCNNPDISFVSPIPGYLLCPPNSKEAIFVPDLGCHVVVCTNCIGEGKITMLPKAVEIEK